MSLKFGNLSSASQGYVGLTSIAIVWMIGYCWLETSLVAVDRNIIAQFSGPLLVISATFANLILSNKTVKEAKKDVESKILENRVVVQQQMNQVATESAQAAMKQLKREK